MWTFILENLTISDSKLYTEITENPSPLCKESLFCPSTWKYRSYATDTVLLTQEVKWCWFLLDKTIIIYHIWYKYRSVMLRNINHKVIINVTVADVIVQVMRGYRHIIFITPWLLERDKMYCVLCIWYFLSGYIIIRDFSPGPGGLFLNRSMASEAVRVKPGGGGYSDLVPTGVCRWSRQTRTYL